MFYVREGSAIRRPEDLGKRIGIPEWVQTAGIYGRGYLSDYVGVKLTSIQWIQAGVNEPDRKTYLNDFVIDFDHGAGIAYIIDSGFQAPNAIIVLDLETGRACRRLNDDRSVRASPADVLAEGAPLLVRPAKGSPEPVEVGAVGIALPPHGETLYWTKPDELFSIRTAMLAASTASDEDVSRAVQCWPTRDFASDGLDWDQEGRIYFPDVSNNGVHA
jgi:sugar lactone lactonase YvrE